MARSARRAIPEAVRNDPNFQKYGANSPPITTDPPEHSWTRRLLLPHFSPKAVEDHRRHTIDRCDRPIDGFFADGTADAAGDYVQQIPPCVIAHLLGIDEERVDEFTYWVRCVLEFGLTKPELRIQYRDVIRDFFRGIVAERAADPGGDDLISALLRGEDPDGNPIAHEVVVGMCNFRWSPGSTPRGARSVRPCGTWQPCRRPPPTRCRRRVVPDVHRGGVALLLPVTMAREVAEEVEYEGVTLQPGDKVLTNFPGANHDPEVFEQPDEFVIDRAPNRHIAHGAGIHRAPTWRAWRWTSRCAPGWNGSPSTRCPSPTP